MPERIASALSRTSIRILLALVLVATTVSAGAWAADVIGDQSPTSSPTATTAAPEPTPEATPAPADEPSFNINGAGGRNIVNLRNTTDDRLIVRGRIQANRIPAPKVAPVNAAIAAASCNGCQTYAVALQINLYQRGASVVAPQNAAVAANGGCSRCVTIARAVQYTIPVDDLGAVPENVKRLARALDKELKGIEGVYDTAEFNAFQAHARISAIVAEFKELGEYLVDQSRIETAADSPSPAAGATPLPTEEPATPTPAESACPSTTSDASSTPTEASAEPSPCAAVSSSGAPASDPSPDAASASP